MTNNQEGNFWLGIFLVLGLAVLVSMLSGCKSTPTYSATVQVEADGDRQVVVFAAKVGT